MAKKVGGRSAKRGVGGAPKPKGKQVAGIGGAKGIAPKRANAPKKKKG